MTANWRLRGPARRGLALPVGSEELAQRITWAFLAVSVAFLIYFDAASPLSSNDDWMMAWEARHLWPLAIYPTQAPLALTQVYFAGLVTIGHTDLRLLRLSVIPFVLLTAYSVYRIARLLTADRFWSGVAAVACLGCPLYMATATTFMTDVPYTALLMAAAAAAVFWITRGTGRVVCILFTGLASVERQIGLLIPIAVTVGLVLAARAARRRLGLPDILALATLWLVVIACYLLPITLQIHAGESLIRGETVRSLNPEFPFAATLVLPWMIGLGLMPFGAALLLTSPEVRRLKNRVGWLILGLILLAGGVAILRYRSLFPGNVFTRSALHYTLQAGSKPRIYPLWLFAGLQVAAALTAAGLVRRSRQWTLGTLQPAGIMLLVLAVSQWVPLLVVNYSVFDRYYIPVFLPLLPVAALLASRCSRRTVAQVAAIASLAIGLGVYVVGEQDYQAWMAARYQAAQLAYTMAPATEVDAGYEQNGVYVGLPYYERTGTILPGKSGYRIRDFSFVGPADPVLEVATVGPGDPRPGFDYRSLAPGRVIVVRPQELEHSPPP
jgi:hypothetical protein